MVLQCLSHALHPLDSIPRSPLAPMLVGNMPPIKGIYLISPGVYNGGTCPSYEENNDHDFVDADTIRRWTSTSFPLIPREQQPYIEPSAAPPRWFDNVPLVVSRILVSVGEYELLRDAVVSFCHIQLKSFKELDVIIMEEGTHIDPILTPDTPEGQDLKEKIVLWFKHGFETLV